MFNKLIQDLASYSIKFPDEQLAVILLNSLPDCFESLINAIEYGRDTLTKEIVINAIRAHDFKAKMREASSREGMFVRGRHATRNGSNNYGNYRDKSKREDKAMEDRIPNRNLEESNVTTAIRRANFKRDCKKVLRDEKGKGHINNGEASIAKGE